MIVAVSPERFRSATSRDCCSEFLKGTKSTSIPSTNRDSGEFADVRVVGSKNVIFIQAKHSLLEPWRRPSIRSASCNVPFWPHPIWRVTSSMTSRRRFLSGCRSPRILAAQPPIHLPEWIARLLIGEAGVSAMTRIRGSSNPKAGACSTGHRPMQRGATASGMNRTKCFQQSDGFDPRCSHDSAGARSPSL